jgi:hypothetical protein
MPQAVHSFVRQQESWRKWVVTWCVAAQRNPRCHRPGPRHWTSSCHIRFPHVLLRVYVWVWANRNPVCGGIPPLCSYAEAITTQPARPLTLHFSTPFTATGMSWTSGPRDLQRFQSLSVHCFLPVITSWLFVSPNCDLQLAHHTKAEIRWTAVVGLAEVLSVESFFSFISSAWTDRISLLAFNSLHLFSMVGGKIRPNYSPGCSFVAGWETLWKHFPENSVW